MRERQKWHKEIVRDLKKRWEEAPGLDGFQPAHLCQVELALRLLERIAPDEPAESAYVLLGGYPYAQVAGLVNGESDRTALLAGRHLLWPLRRSHAWRQALARYRRVPDRLRAYRLPEPGMRTSPRRIDPMVAADRIACYDDALARIPGFVSRSLPRAPAGRSAFQERKRMTSVRFPAELLRDVPEAEGHDLAAGPPFPPGPVEFHLDRLLATARWMDEVERDEGVERPGGWEERLSEVRFATRNPDGRGFTESRSIVLNGTLHLAGMVGAGKSTFMVLAAVTAARRGMRSTLVVGDAAEQLRLCEMFDALGIPAAPVLGVSTREAHVQRLHRRLASRGQTNLLDHQAPAFDNLSTVCVADALRGTESAEPLAYSDAPCTRLHPEKPGPEVESGGEGGTSTLPEVWRPPSMRATQPRRAIEHEWSDDVTATPHGCPLWTLCPRHRAARHQVDALIWVANPSSLVQSPVPSHLNDERLRQLELACHRSNLVFVDEADAVQMRFDELFAPSATLVRPGTESWLDQVHTHKIEELSRRGRLLLTDRDVEQWNAALSVVVIAADRIFRRLIADSDLCDWVDREYFSPWALQEKLITEWFEPPCDSADPDPAEPSAEDERHLYEGYEDDPEDESGSRADGTVSVRPMDPRRAEITAVLDDFRDDPLGDGEFEDPRTRALSDAAEALLHTLAPADVRRRIGGLLDALVDGAPVVDALSPGLREAWRQTTCDRLEFVLLLSVLHQRLDRLIHLWPSVEAALRLDRQGKELARRAPLDYAPVIPEAPMGNVLGYQYQPHEDTRDDIGRTTGTLRFFRCAGVGRELLLSLTAIGEDRERGRPGPNVVLMSGTSWAGESTRAHVLTPVGAVLMPSKTSLDGVTRTRFATHFLYDRAGEPMRLSGTRLDARIPQARAMAERLAQPGAGGAGSVLDQELARIAEDDRRRLLILVGSYSEAYAVAETIDGQRSERWRGRVRVLVPDDADRGHLPGVDGPALLTTVRRGDLAAFAHDPEAEILVAPLMAVERGHNILNSAGKAAFGTAVFLARPHPRPDDISLSVYALNDWITRFVRDQPRDDDLGGPSTFTDLVLKAESLDQAGHALRHAARREWRRLLSRRYAYSALRPFEQRAFAWDQLVTMWQVIGRLVRGGVPARVLFIDAAFAPAVAWAAAPAGHSTGGRRHNAGLLHDLRTVLAPYFGEQLADGRPESAIATDAAVARFLYQPFYEALGRIDHLNRA
ncbi:hypothetical protein ACSNOK_00735 [Streptomyces sp. URMC 126]|uniref:pPIWI_RE_Z domain-containing protein n=1 Tax=Streptomyces sp. URMC 126 TaxID=3423401 RepID=UPI003F1AFD88